MLHFLTTLCDLQIWFIKTKILLIQSNWTWSGEIPNWIVTSGGDTIGSKWISILSSSFSPVDFEAAATADPKTMAPALGQAKFESVMHDRDGETQAERGRNCLGFSNSEIANLSFQTQIRPCFGPNPQMKIRSKCWSQILLRDDVACWSNGAKTSRVEKSMTINDNHH